MPIATGSENSISYGAYPVSYINGLSISNDPTTPNTILNVGPGVTIDSSETFQMINKNTLLVNSAFNGLNGLDSGTFTAAKVYAVYLVSDPVTLQPTAAMLSLSYSGPLMPFGYSAFKLIGFATTASGSAVFLKGYWTAGNSGYRLFMYDAPYATAITAGASTTYAPVNLISSVPNINNIPILVGAVFTPSAAGNLVSIQPGNATGAAYQQVGQVSSVPIVAGGISMAQQVVISSVLSPVINYKVAAGTVAINISGYNFIV